MIATHTASHSPRFDPQAGNIARSANGASIRLTWQSTGDGYCRIDGRMTLSDGRTEGIDHRVFAPCQGQDVRETWEKLVEKIFGKFAETPDLFREQIIPLMDAVHSVLHVMGI